MTGGNPRKDVPGPHEWNVRSKWTGAGQLPAPGHVPGAARAGVPTPAAARALSYEARLQLRPVLFTWSPAPSFFPLTPSLESDAPNTSSDLESSSPVLPLRKL